MRFGYTIIYVDDVSRAIDFYERAFGLARRFVTDDAIWRDGDRRHYALVCQAHPGW